MRIILLGNCQVGGLVDSLKLLAPEFEIQSELVSNDVPTLARELSKHVNLRKTGLMLHDSVQNIINFHPQLQGILPNETIVIPTVTFAAFHPDIQYGFISGNVVKNGLDSDWNSRILLWAYLNKLKEREARELFREEVFRQLGYLDEWAPSVASLKSGFEKYGFDFGRWMRTVQRDGVFMYGINHPLPIALSNLAIQIAERELKSKHQIVSNLHKYVTDYLAHIVWPIYPEIGNEFGVEGTYQWRVGRKYAQLDEFISLCYAAWDSIKLRKREVSFIPLVSEQDNLVLSKFSGKV